MFQVNCVDNQCQMIDEDNLVALVRETEEYQSFLNDVVYMIKFTISQNSLQIIETFGNL